jgi:hypothetical protein
MRHRWIASDIKRELARLCSARRCATLPKMNTLAVNFHIAAVG